MLDKTGRIEIIIILIVLILSVVAFYAVYKAIKDEGLFMEEAEEPLDDRYEIEGIVDIGGAPTVVINGNMYRLNDTIGICEIVNILRNKVTIQTIKDKKDIELGETFAVKPDGSIYKTIPGTSQKLVKPLDKSSDIEICDVLRKIYAETRSQELTPAQLQDLEDQYNGSNVNGKAYVMSVTFRVTESYQMGPMIVRASLRPELQTLDLIIDISSDNRHVAGKLTKGQIFRFRGTFMHARDRCMHINDGEIFP